LACGWLGWGQLGKSVVGCVTDFFCVCPGDPHWPMITHFPQDGMWDVRWGLPLRLSFRKPPNFRRHKLQTLVPLRPMLQNTISDHSVRISTSITVHFFMIYFPKSLPACFSEWVGRYRQYSRYCQRGLGTRTRASWWLVRAIQVCI